MSHQTSLLKIFYLLVIPQPQRNKNTNITSSLNKYFAKDLFQCKILACDCFFAGLMLNLPIIKSCSTLILIHTGS